MKRLLLAVGCLLAVASTYAQGTINFTNPGQGITDFVTGAKIGNTFQVELLAGATATSLAPVAGSTKTILASGLFAGGTLTLANFAPGSTPFFAVRAWETAKGATYDLSLAGLGKTGVSATWQNAALGGGGAPPGPPTAIVNGTSGFVSFSVKAVPEPTVLALGLLGAGALLIRRRK